MGEALEPSDPLARTLVGRAQAAAGRGPTAQVPAALGPSTLEAAILAPSTLVSPAHADAPASARILGTRVHASDYASAVDTIVHWAAADELVGRVVCAANVHMVMEAYDSPEFGEVVNGADLVTSDGMPLVWMLRRLGHGHAQRVYGPDLMLEVCEAVASQGLPVGFYGGTPQVLENLVKELVRRYPRLMVVYSHSPPFRALTEAEDAAIVEEVLASGARLLFVGLGCPKQERWMAAHRDRLPLVQLGVGAAFDFHAGSVRQAPRWMQERGLEWLFRLAAEPRRLWHRYLKHNPRFVALACLQLLRSQR